MNWEQVGSDTLDEAAHDSAGSSVVHMRNASGNRVIRGTVDNDEIGRKTM